MTNLNFVQLIDGVQKILLPNKSEIMITGTHYELSVGEEVRVNLEGILYPHTSDTASKKQEPADKSRAPIKPKRVIYHYPATITCWTDGTKTVVKHDPHDKYSKRMGLFLCHLKKLCGNNSRAFNDMFERMQEIIANKEYEGEKE